MTPDLRDPAAIRRWDDYFTEADRLLATAGGDAADLAGDLRAHVADSMGAMDPTLPERDRLDAALTRLGRPADYLRPLVADELLDRGTRSYRPLPIARGLYHSLLAGSRRALVAAAFGIGYLVLAVFAAMAVLKPLWGDRVGLFRYPDDTVSLGIVAHRVGARDLLGLWTIPLALLATALLYVALTRGLRAARARR